MATERLTLADLRKAGSITSSEIVSAVDAYVHNPSAGPYRFARGHSLDIAAAVATSEEFAKMAVRLGPKEKVFRTAVAAVIMSARLSPPC
jgi:hypothetical protein